MLTKGTIINNQYRLIEELGTGLSATVWRAETLSESDFYVLKIFNLAITKRKEDFYNEWEVMKQFNIQDDPYVHFGIHSFTITNDHTSHNPLGIIVSKWAEYGNLANLIEKIKLGQESLSYRELQDLMLKIVDGLISIHTKKNLDGQYLVHRDLKPSNILLSEKTTPFIADFAISSWVDSERITENPIGAIEYMAPEALEGYISQSIDIWALGTIFYELATAKPLYSRAVWTSPTALMREICTLEKAVPHDFPDSIPIEIQNIILKALEKKPHMRYSSALEMKQALESVWQNNTSKKDNLSISAISLSQTETTNSNNLDDNDDKLDSNLGNNLLNDNLLNDNLLNNNLLNNNLDDNPDNHLVNNNLLTTNLDLPNTIDTLSDISKQTTFWSQNKVALIITLLVGSLLTTSYLYLNSYDELKYPPANLLPGNAPKELLTNFSPVGMVLIPTGKFLMGTNNTAISELQERPEHEVTVKAFYLDVMEVTNEQFSAFLKDNLNNTLLERWKNWTFKETERYYPVTNVTPKEAEAYAKWLGKRLPTEIEWEYAARGSNLGEKKFLYPWGDIAKEVYLYANSEEGGKNKPTSVGSYPEGKSPFGIMDLAGNVAEWTSSCEQSKYVGQTNSTNDCSDNEKIFRGGSYHDGAEYIRTTRRFWLGQLSSTQRRQEILHSIGFRCAQDFLPNTH